MRWVMAAWLSVAGAACADDAAQSAAKPAAESATPAVATAPAPAAAPVRSATTFLSSVPVVKAAPKPAAATPGGVNGTLAVGTARPSDFPDLAKIQLQYAIRAAMTKVQGKVLHIGLEAAGWFLVWEVGIVKADHTAWAIKVDAGNGAVLAVNPVEAGEDRQ
jgi:hypothetical protein